MVPRAWSSCGGGGGGGGFAAVSTHAGAAFGGPLRAPAPGQVVQVRAAPTVWTVVVEAEPDGGAVTLAAFATMDGAPYYGANRCARHALVWDVRGWWRHVGALGEASAAFAAARVERLHRAAAPGALHASGLARDAGLANAAVPSAAVAHAARAVPYALRGRVALFSADQAWDAAFVLAPPAAVAAQNAVAQALHAAQAARGGAAAAPHAWSRIDDAPCVRVPRAEPARACAAARGERGEPRLE